MRREAVVREHMESENHHDFDTTLGTFSHPRYEIVATGDVYDGEQAVRRYYEETRSAFPDQRNELVSLRHADDAVIVEFDLLGTHRGPLRSPLDPPQPSRDDRSRAACRPNQTLTLDKAPTGRSSATGAPERCRSSGRCSTSPSPRHRDRC